MPRRPNTPCSVCGELRWPTNRTKDGLPMVCQPCRRRHGTVYRYRLGCRCGECRSAKAEDQRQVRASFRERNGSSLSRMYRKGSEGRRHVVSAETRLEIYARDGWTCQICLEPVDQDLPHNDRMAATLDHIECQSWVLFPDHSPANLRLAHRSCNSSRKNWTDDELVSR